MLGAHRPGVLDTRQVYPRSDHPRACLGQRREDGLETARRLDAGSGSRNPPGQTGAVPETTTRATIWTARLRLMLGLSGDRQRVEHPEWFPHDMPDRRDSGAFERWVNAGEGSGGVQGPRRCTAP